MRYTIIFMLVVFAALLTSFLSQPTFNGTNPGCSGGGCHSLDDGIVTAAATGNLEVAVTINGVSSGKTIAGELVNSAGQVVDVINATQSNPFTLTAPQSGEYRINAGYKSPERWDSVMVNLITSDINSSTNTNLISNFELYPNHPNPFNNETLIRFSVPQAKDLSLKIYNLNGQLVRKLSEGTFSPGIYSFKWDGRNDDGAYVSSGTYIYELRGAGYHTAKRLTLSK